jgi:hypothetical protein
MKLLAILVWGKDHTGVATDAFSTEVRCREGFELCTGGCVYSDSA